MLQRTNIYLPKKVIAHLKNVARARNSTMTALIRESIEKDIAKQKTKSNPFDSLLKMAENAKKYKGSNLGDLAKNHDTYLYGSKRIK